MDAPPTGRITRFLSVNDEVAGLARVGPIHNQAQAVMRVLKSPETAVHLVTLLEEMPVQETVDGIAELRAAGLPVGGVVVNMVRPVLLDEADLDRRRTDAARRSPRRSRGPAWAARGAAGTPSAWSTRFWSRPASTPSGSAWSAAARGADRSWGLPVRELQLLGRREWTCAGLYRLARRTCGSRRPDERRGGRPTTRDDLAAPCWRSIRCWTTPAPASWCAAAPAASARPRPRRRWAYGPPSAAAGRRPDHRPRPPARAVDGL